MFPLASHTLFLTLAGSQAHGTAREGSDVDLRGVCLAPHSVRVSPFQSFEQYEGDLPEALLELVRPRLAAHPSAARGLEVKLETVLFELGKFIKLCASANPNLLEILFADERDWLYETPAWRRLHEARHRFLSKKVQQTFHGYAMAQLKKIKTHRAWLLSPPQGRPSRADFGFPAERAALSRDDQNRIEQAIAEKLRGYGIDDLDMPPATRVALRERLTAFWSEALAAPEDQLDARMRALATHALELPADVVSALNAEKRYRNALSHYHAYQSWKTHRNPARAALEREHGYDTKHASHLIRLMRMGLELLETGELRVRRPDAAELSAIRDGALSYEALLAEADTLRAAMERAAEATQLPPEVDWGEVEALALEFL